MEALLAAGIAFIIIYLAIVLLMIISMWVIFAKAGQPGWAVLIPIYNFYVMLQVAKKPGWWLVIMLLVPFVNIIFMLMALYAICVNFGKDAGFFIGVLLLPFIFIPILAFGSAKYNPPVAVPPAM
ncbi:MAG: DUF5684 domain-containing protein [Bacteroidota bacterium]